MNVTVFLTFYSQVTISHWTRYINMLMIDHLYLFSILINKVNYYIYWLQKLTSKNNLQYFNKLHPIIIFYRYR